MATTNIGAKVYISDSVTNSDLDQAGFEALTWIELPNVGNHGDSGISQNVVNYSTYGNQVVLKGKGEADAGSPVIECLDEASAGMTAFEAAAVFDNFDSYSTKFEWADGTIEYNRGLVMGPMNMKGANQDFRRVSFTVGNQQAPVKVRP